MNEIEFIIQIAVFILVGIVIFVLYAVDKKKKQFVKKNGIYYNKIIELNNKYNFQHYKKHYKINHYENSKRKLDYLDMDSVILYYMVNNVDNFKNNYDIVKNNRIKYPNYLEEYNDILQSSYDYDESQIIGREFKTLEKFIAFEGKLLKKIKYNDNFDLLVSIHATYTSPKGRNSYYKNDSYNYNRIAFCYERYNEYKKNQETARYQRALMNDSLRYDILKRDNYRCKICGATAQDGVKLHIDHIIPVSRGGKTVPENLQTLCERCNMGKSNKM